MDDTHYEEVLRSGMRRWRPGAMGKSGKLDISFYRIARVWLLGDDNLVSLEVRCWAAYGDKGQTCSTELQGVSTPNGEELNLQH